MCPSNPSGLKKLILHEDGGLCFNDRAQWSPGGLYIQASEEATAEECAEIALRLGQLSKEVDKTSATVQLSIGRVILDYVARRKGCSVEQAISELELDQATGRDWRTVAKWARIIEVLSEEEIHEHLTASQLYAAASVAPPKDPKEIIEFRRARKELLERAAENPNFFGYRRIEGALKDFALGFKTARKTIRRSSDTEVLRRSVLVMWLCNFSDEDLKRMMVDKSTLHGLKAEAENVLYERGLLPFIDDAVILPAKIQ